MLIVVVFVFCCLLPVDGNLLLFCIWRLKRVVWCKFADCFLPVVCCVLSVACCRLLVDSRLMVFVACLMFLLTCCLLCFG